MSEGPAFRHGPRPRPAESRPALPEESAALNARIAIVATIVTGQLWGITVALDAWYRHDLAAVWWLVGFQVVSFAIALGVWAASRRPGA